MFRKFSVINGYICGVIMTYGWNDEEVQYATWYDDILFIAFEFEDYRLLEHMDEESLKKYINILNWSDSYHL